MLKIHTFRRNTGAIRKVICNIGLYLDNVPTTSFTNIVNCKQRFRVQQPGAKFSNKKDYYNIWGDFF